MFVRRVLITSCDAVLVKRLDDRLRETYVVELALSSGQALSKLRSKAFSALLVDRNLMGPGVLEMALRLAPGLHVVSIGPQDVSRTDEVVGYLNLIEKSSEWPWSYNFAETEAMQINRDGRTASAPQPGW